MIFRECSQTLHAFFRGRLIDRIGNIGPWSNWVSATTSADASAVLDILSGKITETQLHQDLQTKIDKIDTIAGLDGDIGNLIDNITAVQTQADQLNTALNQETQQRISVVQDLNDGLTQEIEDRQSGDTANLNALNNYKSSNDQALANVQQQVNTAVTATSANTQAVQALDSRVTTAASDASTAKTNAATALNKAETATTQAGSAASLASQASAIANQAADTADTANQTAATALSTANVSATQSGANATRLDAIALELGDKASTGALSQTDAKVAEHEGKISANTTKIDGVYAQVNPKLIGSTEDLIGSTEGFAGVWSIQSALIEGDMAQAQRTDQVVATISENDALYKQQIKANADAVSANVQATTTLQTTVGQNTASIQEVSQSVNGLYAQKYIKLDVNGKVAGWGGANDGKESNFILNFDSFAIGSGNSTGYYPFIFRNTPFTDPVTGTVFPVSAYFKSAMMDYQSVKTSHIEDLAVKTAKIDDLAVTRGKIADLAVNTLKIQDEAVTVPTSVKSTSEFTISGAYDPINDDYNAQLAKWEAKFGNLLSVTVNRSGGKCRIDASCIAFRHEYLTAYATDGGTLSYQERLNLRAVVSVYRNGTLVARQETPPSDVIGTGSFYFTGIFAINAGIEDTFAGQANYVLKLGFANRNTRPIRVVINHAQGAFSVQNPQMILTEMKK